MIRRRVVVHGRVQGVFFRDTTRRMADSSRGSAGWVATRAEGTVEAVFEGEHEARRGAGASRTRARAAPRCARVEVTEEEPEGLTGFRVR